MVLQFLSSRRGRCVGGFWGGGGGNEIEGEGEYFRERLAFSVFSGLLEMFLKRSACAPPLILLRSVYGAGRTSKTAGL